MKLSNWLRSLMINYKDNYDFGLEVGEREGALNAYEKLKNIIENK